MTTYTCKACLAPAKVVNGAVVKACACQAPVIANIQATARGAGGMK